MKRVSVILISIIISSRKAYGFFFYLNKTCCSLSIIVEGAQVLKLRAPLLTLEEIGTNKSWY